MNAAVTNNDVVITRARASVPRAVTAAQRDLGRLGRLETHQLLKDRWVDWVGRLQVGRQISW